MSRLGAWHRVLQDGMDVPPALWRTWCGWNHGKAFARVRRSAALPPSTPWRSICERCLPDLRAEAKLGAFEEEEDTDAERGQEDQAPP